MFVPTLYAETDPAVVDQFIRDHGFATLVTAAGTEPFATHIPLELVHTSDGRRVLEGHVSRANPHWRELESGARALAIFAGPHTYVSSTWYGQENVPTWNYMVVHAWGTARMVTSETAQREMLQRLARHYEPEDAAPPRFEVDGLSPGFYAKEVRGIVGFTIEVDRVQASFKLSQNRNPADHANVIRRLLERGDENSVAIARAMAAPRPAPP